MYQISYDSCSEISLQSDTWLKFFVVSEPVKWTDFHQFFTFSKGLISQYTKEMSLLFV